MAILYIAAGINHFIYPAFYEAIMPGWLPAHRLLIFISGVAEVLLGSLLFFAPTRRLAAWGIIALLIAIFPANLHMAYLYYTNANPHLWMALLRLPLQFVLIWWAYQYTHTPSFKSPA